MNNLHRELAPVSDKAWAQIEQEASRTLKRYLAARRVVDVNGPKGPQLAAVDTGHLRAIKSPGNDVQASMRDVRALVDMRMPFELSRQTIDDVDRGSLDSDWTPLKEAARKIAFVEDWAVFDGFAGAGIQGIRQVSSNEPIPLPEDPEDYPLAVAKALNELKMAGVNGPYTLVLGAEAYTAASGESDDGYPIFHHLEKVVGGGVVWAPAVHGGFLLTTRGGDFVLDIGQDFSIGYLGHTAKTVELYFEESFTFRVLTSEASVVLTPR